MKRILPVIVSLLLFTAGTAGASMTLASWNLTGQPGTQEESSGISTDYVTAENMVRGSGLSPYTGSNSFNSSGWSNADADDYLEFGFTVASGYTATLSQLWIGTRSSGTGPGTIGIFTSLDNFTSPVFTISQPDSTYMNNIIDLSALDPVTGTFYVRLIEIGDTKANGDGATAGTGTFRIAEYKEGTTYTDVQITGDVSAVPLPAAAWLLGSGLVGLLGVRRRG